MNPIIANLVRHHKTIKDHIGIQSGTKTKVLSLFCSDSPTFDFFFFARTGKQKHFIGTVKKFVKYQKPIIFKQKHKISIIILT